MNEKSMVNEGGGMAHGAGGGITDKSYYDGFLDINGFTEV